MYITRPGMFIFLYIIVYHNLLIFTSFNTPNTVHVHTHLVHTVHVHTHLVHTVHVHTHLVNTVHVHTHLAKKLIEYIFMPHMYFQPRFHLGSEMKFYINIFFTHLLEAIWVRRVMI